MSYHFQAKFLDFKIQNMVGSCDVKFPIRLEGLVLTHGQFSRLFQFFFLINNNINTYNNYCFAAMNQNCFLVLFTEWLNHVLCYLFLYQEKSYLQVFICVTHCIT